jgi:circadian clock protein KaiC
MKELEKISTGIPSLDAILDGGLPRNSVNVIAGPPGTGKTILAQQIVFHNALHDDRAPYLVTVSEPTVKLLRYQQQFTFFDPDRVGQNVIYLDIGSTLLEGDLNEVTRQIEEYIAEYSPTILAIDSFKAIHEVAKDAPQLREFAYRLAVRLTTWGTTTLLVGEYTRQAINDAPIFAVADGIILMNHESRGMETYRYLEVLKMRGSGYFSGRHPFTISADGITVYPRLKTPASSAPYPVGETRVSLGVPGLDEMAQSGVLSATSTLVAGSAGTGKTLLCLHFLLEGIRKGEPGLLITFQETPSMLRAFARGFGWDLEQLEAEGLLHLLYSSPVEMGVDEHAHTIRRTIAETGARRVAMDSLKDIELATPDKVRYKDYIYSLVNDFRRQGITSLLTSEIAEMFGTFIVSEYGISFVADNVVLLRYVEMEGRVARAISVLKMRGSDHDKSVREFQITAQAGLEVLQPFEKYDAVLTGAAVTTGVPGAAVLPPRARRILRTLTATPGSALDELAESINDTPERTGETLETLLQLGYVLRYSKDGETCYKPSVLWSQRT